MYIHMCESGEGKGWCHTHLKSQLSSVMPNAAFSSSNLAFFKVQLRGKIESSGQREFFCTHNIKYL